MSVNTKAVSQEWMNVALNLEGDIRMWSTVVYEEKKTNPSSRSKHSVTLLGNYLYLLGGRNGNLPLKDFWRYDLSANYWEPLNPSGDVPPCLQEHTAVAYKENIYVFGGELSFSASNETPLWVYYTKTNNWLKIRGQKGTSIPKGRRGHTALVHHGSALVYGGYCDLRGSSNELWVFHFETQSWHLLMNGRNDPPGRHKHSAVLHDDSMWIYGGMTNLQERSDMWRFDIVTKKWTNIRCKISPGALHSHAVCKLPSSMLIFGGERNGQAVNELWRFHFGIDCWEHIHTDIFCPQPLSDCSAVAVSELVLLRNGKNLTESNKCSDGHNRNAVNSANAVQKSRCSFSDNEGSCSGRRNNNLFRSHLEQSCTFDRKTSLQGVMVPPRRQATTPNSCNLNIFREISKFSHLNLYQNMKCNYSVLNSNSNESINNSEESNNTEMTKCYSSNNVVASTGSLKLQEQHIASVYAEPTESSYVNGGLVTPIEATKLVYLDGEEACIPDDRSETVVRRNSNVTGTGANINRNRRSFPGANSVRFANPLVTPDEEPISESVRKFSSSSSFFSLCDKSIGFEKSDYGEIAVEGTNGTEQRSLPQSPPISFSNPIYFNGQQSSAESDQRSIEKKIARGDYVKVLGPTENIAYDNTAKYESLEMRPIPPNSLPLQSNCAAVVEKRRKYHRASSTGRYNGASTSNVVGPYSNSAIAFYVFLVGGKENSQLTVFQRPISMWKLTLSKRIY